jgi:hypothetical protein
MRVYEKLLTKAHGYVVLAYIPCVRLCLHAQMHSKGSIMRMYIHTYIRRSNLHGDYFG